MGNRFSRRRYAPAGSGPTGTTEQKIERLMPKPSDSSDKTACQEESTDVFVEEESAPQREEDPSAAGSSPQKDADSASPEALIALSNPPESDLQDQPKPASPEPESGSDHRAEADPASELEPCPAEALLHPEKPVCQEGLLDTVLPVALAATDAPSPPPPILSSFSPGESSNASAREQHDERAPAVESSLTEPENLAETLTPQEKPDELQAAESLEALADDVSGENAAVLRGIDLLTDQTPSEGKTADDAPMLGMNTSIELM